MSDSVRLLLFYQLEQHLYGSSRLGLWNPGLDLSTTFDIDTSWLSEGRRTYELTNHLGNVLATISDKRIPVYENDGTTVAYYDVDLLSAVDYYPFGMQMPGRVFNGGGYRYGFNGKENDDEVKGDGNQQDYGMRMYDPRIAKFLSVDPLTKSFPWYTPYQFAGNKPIWAVDLDGAEEKVTTQYTLDYKPVLNAPTVIDGIGNALHNVIALGWNSTGGGFMEGEKAVWNFGVGLFNGEYNHVSGKDLVDNFMVAQEDVARYFTKTPLKQQLSDLGEAATNMSSYEAVTQLWLGLKFMPPSKVTGDLVDDGAQILTHYTDEAGYNGILESQEFRPSIGYKNARHGDGQYFTDMSPDNIVTFAKKDLSAEQISSGQISLGQASQKLYGIPYNAKKMTHYIQIDVKGLDISNPKPGIFLNKSNTNLNLGGRIKGSGLTLGGG